jgi:hypothetical protein
MVVATPFVENPGWVQLLNENTTNIMNASVTAIKNSGGGVSSGGPIIFGLMFGFIPILLGVMAYMRFRKTLPAAIVTFFSQWAMLWLGWTDPHISQIIMVIAAVGVIFGLVFVNEDPNG